MEKPHITISDVAERANVSKMSVSRVLNGQTGVSEKTRQRILEAVEQLGYVAQPIRGRRGKHWPFPGR